ncbi:hypothetical protein [Dyadobacter sp. CY343]|uniref:hypothetical protein n=1 Tax=Dyadobacter sp. CY343 TaxID=2907299 RepID=UPI001F48B565|nr:hypothetical protein [Dyadobacter sp. CY343]MCE7062586.1 hypothetical protein [Dyadobacter sp. CY343]
MKNYVIVILLALLPAWTNAQKNKAREIAKAALQKMTDGKRITSFELEITYDLPGRNPVEFTQPNGFIMLIDSLMPTFPDSIQKVLRAKTNSLKASSYQTRIDMFKGQRNIILCDVSNEKSASITLKPDSLQSSTDTSRSISGVNKDMPFVKPYIQNPAYLLQLMVSDSTELHYSGMTVVDREENHIIQVKIDGKWVDTYIGSTSLLPSRIALQQVDEEVLVSHSPKRYKEFHVYSQYQRFGGILLPKSLEEISSRTYFTIRQRLNWVSVNAPLRDDAFKTGSGSK